VKIILITYIIKKTVQVLNIQELRDISIITRIFRNKEKEKDSILRDFEKQLRESLKIDIEIEDPKTHPLKIIIPSLGKISLFVTGLVKKKFFKSSSQTSPNYDQGDHIVNFLKNYAKKTFDDFEENPISLQDILDEYNDQGN
jgi:hypothetical protein